MADDEKFIDPMKIDMMLTDFCEKEATEVSKKNFLFEMNSAANEQPPVFPLEGIIWGENGRMLVPIVVSHGNASIKTLALYNCGCRPSFLSKSTLHKLGMTDDGISSTMNICMHGRIFSVHLSHSHFKDVNVIGQSFHQAKVMVEYDELKFVITK